MNLKTIPEAPSFLELFRHLVDVLKAGILTLIRVRKYITKGFITVSLSLDSLDNAPEGSVHERVLELKVCDTGKGISSHYLRTSLFTRT